MKRFISRILNCCGSRNESRSGQGDHEATDGVAAPSMRLTVSDGAITINDQNVELPGSFAAIKQLFGEPSRALSNIRIWDELGVFVHLASDEENADNMTVVFGPFDADHWPKEHFTGLISIDGQSVGASTRTSNLKSAGYEKFGSVLWLRQSGDREIDVQFNDRQPVAVYVAPKS